MTESTIMNAAIDPWVVTPRERVKYQEQFRSLKPQNEIVTGQGTWILSAIAIVADDFGRNMVSFACPIFVFVFPSFCQ